MKVYLNQSVLDAAKARIRWVFDEFEVVHVNVSGGKDSTVVFNLALEVAREMGRLPLNVYFLDQECEWEATIEQIKFMMYHPDVNPYWLQVPFELFNATSTEEHWLNVWGTEDKHRWVRPKDPISIKENPTGKTRFKQVLASLPRTFRGDTPTGVLIGMRAEESPGRLLGMTQSLTYKDVCWGRIVDPKRRIHFNFFPIYDWSYLDVWKFIHDNDLPYCKIYDLMYRYGMSLLDMRVSNVHHETAVGALFFMQEVEPVTYERIVGRIKGIHAAAKLKRAGFVPSSLPPMFKDWQEYRDHLLRHLILKPEWRTRMEARFGRQDADLKDMLGTKLPLMQIKSILTNDWEGVLSENFNGRGEVKDALRVVRRRKAVARLSALSAMTPEDRESALHSNPKDLKLWTKHQENRG